MHSRRRFFAAMLLCWSRKLEEHGIYSFEKWLASPKGRVAGREYLVSHFGCNDCGAQAGRECKPEYGCRKKSRNVAPDIVRDHGELEPEILDDEYTWFKG